MMGKNGKGTQSKENINKNNNMHNPRDVGSNEHNEEQRKRKTDMFPFFFQANTSGIQQWSRCMTKRIVSLQWPGYIVSPNTF